MTMFALITTVTYLAAQLVGSSPLPQASAATDGATIVSGFVPSPGGPPNETLYVVTASDATYLAGIATVTATGEDSSPTTVVEKDVFRLTNDTIDYYYFNGTDVLVQAVECVVDGTIADCNGTVIDLSHGIGIEAASISFTGASTGVTAYAPTGTADPSAISFATAAPSLVASATASLSSVISSIKSVGMSLEASASSEAASLESSASANVPGGATETDSAGSSENTGIVGGGDFTLTIAGATVTA